MKLKDEELQQISGGAAKFGIGLLIGAGITFLVGIIDGYQPQCLYKIFFPYYYIIIYTSHFIITIPFLHFQFFPTNIFVLKKIKYYDIFL